MCADPCKLAIGGLITPVATPTDVYETEEAIVVCVEIAGVQEDGFMKRQI